MTSLAEISQPFVDMAHSIVWCTVATVDRKGRPRSRVLHPIWEIEDDNAVGTCIHRVYRIGSVHNTF